MTNILTGTIAEPKADEVTRLRREIAGLELQNAVLTEKNAQLETAITDSAKAIALMREHFRPQFETLRVLFGAATRAEADAVETASQNPRAGGPNGRYDAWKRMVPNSERRVIEVLEVAPGGMTAVQISKAAGMAYNTAKDCVTKLVAKGFAVRNGNEVTLK